MAEKTPPISENAPNPSLESEEAENNKHVQEKIDVDEDVWDLNCSFQSSFAIDEAAKSSAVVDENDLFGDLIHMHAPPQHQQPMPIVETANIPEKVVVELPKTKKKKKKKVVSQQRLHEDMGTIDKYDQYNDY